MAEWPRPALAATLVLAGALAPGRSLGQAPPDVRLGAADAIAPEPFSLIKGLRELSDGRVLITDWIEQRLVVIDFARGSLEDVGRVGPGPREFRLPDRLLALPGDTTLLVDVGNGRLAVIAPTLEIVRTISIYAHGESYAMNPHGADGRGVLYFQLSPFAIGRGAPSDSVAIGRWGERADRVTFVGDRVLLKAYTSRPSGSRPRPGLPYVAFAKQDDWAVTSDGAVAVVRSSPYRVEWYGPGNRVLVGPAVAYTPIAVTADDRRREVRDFLRGSYVSGRGNDGGAGHVSAAMQSDQEIDRIAREGDFAAEFPPFRGGAVWAAGDHIWVQRAAGGAGPPSLDVFDRSGRRIASVALPAGRTVIGFGSGTLYATVTGADDLLTLERYRLPVLSN